MNGWVGKILQVDLSTSEITQFPTKPYADKYLGGRGIGARLYWEKVRPETGAFDPENCVIFMTGPIVATGAQGATITAVVGKSPATIPEGYCYGSLTGFVGAELKKAGFDGVVVTGRASKPVYIFIEDGHAKLIDASGLWGRNGYETGRRLEKIHGERTRYIAIGAAGEHMVRTAVALASHDCTVSAGFGAVLGSKNLKAIAVRGSGKVEVADRKKLHELNRYTFKISKRIRLTIPPLIEGTKQAGLLEVIGKGNCHLCGLECVAGVYRYGQKKELVGHRKCQSVEYYRPWAYAQDDEPVETFFEAPVMANDCGFETWEMQSIIDWLYDCYQAGALTEEETGLPLSKIGTRDFLEKLMHAIAYREGFGDILAEGLFRAGEKVSAKARALFHPTVAPIGMNYLFPPRSQVIMALLYPFEPRVHHINYHDIGFVHVAWTRERHEPGSTGITNREIRKIAKMFWGSEAAGDFTSYEGKAMAAKIILNRTYLKEMLGLCDWAYPISYSLNTADHMGDPDIEKKLCTAVIGITGEALDLYAERVYNLQRMILLKEGRRIPEDDYPLEYNFTEPLLQADRIGKILVPGPGDRAVDMTGNKLDKKKFTMMLQEYYALRGWDVTGQPMTETLTELGIANLIPSSVI